MVIKSWFYIFVICLFSSCSTRIPIVKNTDTYHQSPLGSFIELKVRQLKAKLTYRGELIAVDEKRIMIKTSTEGHAVISFSKKDLVSYNLYYAENEIEDYNRWGLLNMASTLSHGWFLILTMPINAIVLGTINSNKKSEFRYNNRELPYNQLYKFARFPQGLPSFINEESPTILNDW